MQNEAGAFGEMRRWLQGLPAPLKTLIKAVFAPRYYWRIAVNDVRAYFGHVPGGSRIIFIAGYPKSGTTWVENFVSNVPGYNPRVLGGDPEILRHHELPDDAFDRMPRYGFSSVKTHINPSSRNIEVLARNGVNKVLVMYRDPRDIVVSNYYYVLKNNPWKSSDSFYADYNKISKDQALSHSLDLVVGDFSAWVRGWKKVAAEHRGVDCMFLRYEDLRTDPIGSFRKILSFFDISLTQSQFETAMSASQGGSGKGEGAIGMPGKRSTKRKGAFGEWRSELNADQKRLFKEKVGELLVELGYESGSEW